MMKFGKETGEETMEIPRERKTEAELATLKKKQSEDEEVDALPREKERDWFGKTGVARCPKCGSINVMRSFRLRNHIRQCLACSHIAVVLE